VSGAVLEAGQLAALGQSVADWRAACRVFACTPGTGAQMRAAEARLRAAGRDPATGLVTLPAAAVHFTDVRADGARMTAVNGSLLGGPVWICWSGRSLRFGTEARDYAASDLVQVRSAGSLISVLGVSRSTTLPSATALYLECARRDARTASQQKRASQACPDRFAISATTS
jgi:hypothetical protein